MSELYKTHRPKLFKEVVGQDDACRMLSQMVKENRVPHALLFLGPSGCGKTTLARILKEKLKCEDSDFTEINAAEARGIDTIREVKSRMGLAPMKGGVRIYLFDEAHKLSNDAQNALLKLLEDTPKHVYFMLATTEPEKLIATIRSRCTDVKLKSIPPAKMKELLDDICMREKKDISEAVIDRIIEHSEGGGRKALVLLNAVLNIENEDDQLNTIVKSDVRAQAIELARILIFKAPTWSEVAKIIEGLDEEPESLRRMILGYAASVLLKGGKGADRAFFLIDVFKESFFNSGKAGLVAACYAVSKTK